MILVVFLVYLCFAQVLVFDKDIIEFECFSWDDRNNQEKLKTKVMQFFSLGRWGGGGVVANNVCNGRYANGELLFCI